MAHHCYQRTKHQTNNLIPIDFHILFCYQISQTRSRDRKMGSVKATTVPYTNLNLESADPYWRLLAKLENTKKRLKCNPDFLMTMLLTSSSLSSSVSVEMFFFSWNALRRKICNFEMKIRRNNNLLLRLIKIRSTSGGGGGGIGVVLPPSAKGLRAWCHIQGQSFLERLAIYRKTIIADNLLNLIITSI